MSVHFIQLLRVVIKMAYYCNHYLRGEQIIRVFIARFLKHAIFKLCEYISYRVVFSVEATLASLIKLLQDV